MTSATYTIKDFVGIPVQLDDTELGQQVPVTVRYKSNGNALIVEQTSSSDYYGSLMYRVNCEYIWNKFADSVILVSGNYDYEAIAITEESLQNQELVEVLTSLTSYPLLDEDRYAELCLDAYYEAMEEYGISDLVRELKKVFGLSDRAVELLESACGDQMILWFESMIRSGEYYFEEHTSIVPNIGSCVYYCERDDMALLLRELRACK